MDSASHPSHMDLFLVGLVWWMSSYTIYLFAPHCDHSDLLDSIVSPAYSLIPCPLKICFHCNHETTSQTVVASPKGVPGMNVYIYAVVAFPHIALNHTRIHQITSRHVEHINPSLICWPGITSNICSIFSNGKHRLIPHLSRPRIFHQVTAICASKSFRVRSTRRLAMAATASGLTSGPWPGPAAGDRSMRSLRGATKCSFCVRRSCNLALAFPKLSRRFVKTLFWGGGKI